MRGMQLTNTNLAKNIGLVDRAYFPDSGIRGQRNAVKFTEEKGEIEIGAARTDRGLVNVWVRDNGEGIPADEIGQIFQKYRQVGNIKNPNQEGTGLGLVICKMIVEAHWGKIWVESEPKKGSTFYFSLPLAT